MSANLEHFQDRLEAIESFDNMWVQDKPWILAYTGMSGNGKSTLLDWLETNRCLSGFFPYALIGLGEFVGKFVTALDCILEAPSIRRYLSVPVLQNYRSKRREALEDRHRRHISLVQTQTMYASQGAEQTMSAGLVEAVRELNSQTDQLLVELWLECISSLSLEQSPIFLLDNYDVFQESASFEEISFFWTAIEKAYNNLPKLRVVLASREKVRHQERLRTFENGLLKKSLTPLEREDSDALLRSLGVHDQEYWKAVYVGLAQGHPLITRMAASLVGNAWRHPGSRSTTIMESRTSGRMGPISYSRSP